MAVTTSIEAPGREGVGWGRLAVVGVVWLLLGPVAGLAGGAVLVWSAYGRPTAARGLALAGLLVLATATAWLAAGVPSTFEVASFTNLGGRDWIDALARAGIGVLVMAVGLPDNPRDLEDRPVPTPRQEPWRLPEVDRLRAIAIVTVVLIHGLPYRAPITGYIDYWLSDITRFSVALLFLLSGWLVPDTATGMAHVRRRLVRLVPAYLVASTVMLTLARLTPAIDSRPVLPALLLGDAVGPYYFVVVMVVLVVLTPLLVRATHRTRVVLLVLGAVASFSIELADLSVYAHNHLPPTWFVYYLAGMMLSSHRDRLRDLSQTVEGFVLLVTAVLVVAIGLAPIETTPRRVLVWFGIWAIMASLLLVTRRDTHRTTVATRTLSSRSYAIYLYHPVLVAALAGRFGSSVLTLRPLVATAVAVVMTVAFAHLASIAWPTRAGRWVGA